MKRRFEKILWNLDFVLPGTVTDEEENQTRFGKLFQLLPLLAISEHVT